MGIKNVVDENERVSSDGHGESACSACEMAVVWMDHQLRRNQTRDRILNHTNEVI